jgi:hypothetical protein
MVLSPVLLKQWKDTVDRILHVPGNFTGKVLEMTVVIDKNLSAEIVRDILPQLLKALKMHDKTFQNVHFNLTYWEQDERMVNNSCPMAMAITEGFYQNYQEEHFSKDLGNLMTYLKLFHARSKLIILLTDGDYHISDMEVLDQSMQPFLEKKLLMLKCMQREDGCEITVRYRNFI